MARTSRAGVAGDLFRRFRSGDGFGGYQVRLEMGPLDDRRRCGRPRAGRRSCPSARQVMRIWQDSPSVAQVKTDAADTDPVARPPRCTCSIRLTAFAALVRAADVAGRVRGAVAGDSRGHAAGRAGDACRWCCCAARRTMTRGGVDPLLVIAWAPCSACRHPWRGSGPPSRRSRSLGRHGGDRDRYQGAGDPAGRVARRGGGQGVVGGGDR